MSLSPCLQTDLPSALTLFEPGPSLGAAKQPVNGLYGVTAAPSTAIGLPFTFTDGARFPMMISPVLSCVTRATAGIVFDPLFLKCI
jgi:hypothetical protein